MVAPILVWLGGVAAGIVSNAVQNYLFSTPPTANDENLALYTDWKTACGSSGSVEACCAFWENLSDENARILMGMAQRPDCSVDPPPSTPKPGNVTNITINETNTTINETTIVINPPKIIFDPPDIISTETTIELPPRRLSPPPNPNSTKVSAVVCQSFAIRQWGCMLAEPVGGKTVIEVCDTSPILQAFNEFQGNWLVNLMYKMITDFLGVDFDSVLDDLISAGALILGIKNPILVGGINLLVRHLLEGSRFTSLPLGGVIPNGIEIVTKVCDVIQDPPQLPEITIQSDPPQKTIELPPEVAEPEEKEDNCNLAIPVRNYKLNLPHNEGHKRQLAITFVRSYTELTENHHLTIPNPKPTLTKDKIRQVLGSSVTFGEVKYECDVLPYGYIRFYGEDGKEAEIKAWFESMIDEFVKDGSMKVDSFRFSKRKRNYSTGVFYPYVAYDLNFSTPNPSWVRYDLRPPKPQ